MVKEKPIFKVGSLEISTPVSETIFITNRNKKLFTIPPWRYIMMLLMHGKIILANQLHAPRPKAFITMSGGCLDGLIVVDLTKVDPKLLAAYLSEEGARSFLEYHDFHA